MTKKCGFSNCIKDGTVFWFTGLWVCQEHFNEWFEKNIQTREKITEQFKFN